MVPEVHGTLGDPVTLPPKVLTHYPAPLTVPVTQKFFVSLGLFFQAMFSSPLTW